MLSFTDDDYLRAKAIRRGQQRPSAEMRALAQWIAERFGCEEPLHIELAWCASAQSLRLQVVFEHEGAERRFMSDDGNYDSEKQAAIARQFRAIEAAAGREHGDFFVIFSEFEPTARWEAHSAAERAIGAVGAAAPGARIWTIHPMFDAATIFLHTEAERERMSDDDRRRIAAAYMAALRPHDEFGYFRARPIALFYDSRERFDREFNGSWFAYDRQ